MESNTANKMSWRLVGAALGIFGPSPLRAILWGTVFTAAVIAVAFAAYGAYAALSISLEGYWAAASVAGGAILLAIVLVAITQMSGRSVQPGRTRMPSQGVAPDVVAELMVAIRTSPKEAAAVALVAGLLAGLCPELLNAARTYFDREQDPVRHPAP